MRRTPRVWPLLSAALAWASTLAAAPLDGTADRSCTTAGCHDLYARRDSVHPPVAAAQCGLCHEKRDGAAHAFKTTADTPQLCATCHPDAMTWAATAGRGGVVGACTLCHDPHGSDHGAMLVADTASLCRSCHDEVARWTAPGRIQHGDITEDCTACHAPHGSPDAPALRSPMPGLCTGCHEDIGKVVSSAVVEHKAWTMDHHCANCHDPHSAKLEHLLRREPRDLCLLCHDRVLESGGETIADIGALLRENPYHHGPIRAGNCSGCHTEIHGGSARRRLEKSMAQEFYVPYDSERYALCFMCHDDHLTGTERTTAFTDFRNGDQNLHFVHVNRRNKGRSCRVCHDVHASRHEDQITDGVTFGPAGWKLPIRFERSATGGSCQSGCHREHRYDRSTPVVNPGAAPSPVPQGRD